MQNMTGYYCVNGVLHSPNTSKHILKQSCELDTKINAHGSWSGLFTHVDAFRWFSKDVWMKWFQALMSETLLQPRAVLAAHATLNGPFTAVSIEVRMKSTPVNSLKINIKTVTNACEDRIEHGDWQLVDHFLVIICTRPLTIDIPCKDLNTCQNKQ